MPERAVLAGSLIADGLRGVLDGYQMDLEFIKKTFYLTRSWDAIWISVPQHIHTTILNPCMCCIQGDYTRKQMCFLCQAWPCKGSFLKQKNLRSLRHCIGCMLAGILTGLQTMPSSSSRTLADRPSTVPRLLSKCKTAFVFRGVPYKLTAKLPDEHLYRDSGWSKMQPSSDCITLEAH